MAIRRTVTGSDARGGRCVSQIAAPGEPYAGRHRRAWPFRRNGVVEGEPWCRFFKRHQASGEPYAAGIGEVINEFGGGNFVLCVMICYAINSFSVSFSRRTV